MAERLRVAIEEEGARQPMPLTVSVGVASVYDNQSLPDALHRADMALLVAKRAGRNRVQVDTLDASV